MRSAHAASTSASLSRDVSDRSVSNVAACAGESRSSKISEKASAISSALVGVCVLRRDLSKDVIEVY